MRGMLPVALLGLALAAHPAGAVDVNVDSSFQLGSGDWWSNVSTVTITPVPEISIGISGGQAVTATPVSDRAEAWGVSASGEVASRLSASAGYTSYAGNRAMVVDAGTLGLAGRSAERQRNALFGFDLTAKVFSAADENGEMPEDAILQTVSVSLGVAGGTHRAPGAVVNLPAGSTMPATDVRLQERTVTAGLSVVMEANTISATAARHRYNYPGGWERGIVDRMYAQSPVAVAAVIAGLPDWGMSGTYQETLPWQGASILASYSYTRMAAPNVLVRSITAELGWSLARWLSARGGCLWVRESGRTTRYALGGLSLIF